MERLNKIIEWYVELFADRPIAVSILLMALGFAAGRF